jgi:hypothetical protein
MSTELREQIICPQCRTVSKGVYKYCVKCNTKLLVDCPNCFQTNSVANPICKNCGTNIQVKVQQRETWRDEKKRHDEERMVNLQESERKMQEISIQTLLDDLDEPEKHPLTLFLLHERGSEAVEPLIETLYTDVDVDARYGAARVLGMIGDARSIPALIKALSDQEPSVRYWAVDALGNLGAQSALGAIRKLKWDSFRKIRERAKLAIEQIQAN